MPKNHTNVYFFLFVYLSSFSQLFPEMSQNLNSSALAFPQADWGVCVWERERDPHFYSAQLITIIDRNAQWELLKLKVEL